jgi:hypothetical protein
MLVHDHFTYICLLGGVCVWRLAGIVILNRTDGDRQLVCVHECVQKYLLCFTLTQSLKDIASSSSLLIHTEVTQSSSLCVAFSLRAQQCKLSIHDDSLHTNSAALVSLLQLIFCMD